jgi:CBS domain-containing protein
MWRDEKALESQERTPRVNISSHWTWHKVREECKGVRLKTLTERAKGASNEERKQGVVREIMMGSPVCLKPEDTLDLANDIISLGRIRHIPIIDEGRLVGILSERDLIGATATYIFGLKQKNKSALLKSFAIKDVMKKRVITVGPDTKSETLSLSCKRKK